MISGRTPGFCDACGVRIFGMELCSILWIEWIKCLSRGPITSKGKSFGGITCNTHVCAGKLLVEFEKIEESRLRLVLSIGRDGVFLFMPVTELNFYDEERVLPKNIWLRIEALEAERSKSLKKKSGNWRWGRGG